MQTETVNNTTINSTNNTNNTNLTTVFYPGPQEVLVETPDIKIYGILKSEDFLSGKQIADAIGLKGKEIEHSDNGWIKYSINGEMRYMAVRPILYGLSWIEIYRLGAVYSDGRDIVLGGDKPPQTASVNHKGLTYRVRLPEGQRQNPADAESCPRTGEWDILFNVLNRDGVMSKLRDDYSFASFYHMQGGYHIIGNRSFCQESLKGENARILTRTHNPVCISHFKTIWDTTPELGWRPVLVVMKPELHTKSATPPKESEGVDGVKTTPGSAQVKPTPTPSWTPTGLVLDTSHFSAQNGFIPQSNHPKQERPPISELGVPASGSNTPPWQQRYQPQQPPQPPMFRPGQIVTPDSNIPDWLLDQQMQYLSQSVALGNEIRKLRLTPGDLEVYLDRVYKAIKLGLNQ
jgi:hypothetical protein